MGAYSVPENIRKLKPKGTMVKRVGDRFYVYTFKNYKDENGKRKTKTISCIGKIEDGLGFVPNKNYIANNSKTCYEYGQYAATFQASKPILDKLCEVFNPEDAHRIYLHALLQVVNKYTAVTKVEKDFEQSYFKVFFPKLSMSYYKLSNLLDDLGRKQTQVIDFEQKLLDEAEEIAVDGHVIRTESDYNDLSEYGYKYQELKAPQMNLLMAYDTNRKIPVFSRMFPGNKLDKVSFSELLNRYNYKNILFLIDRGFYNEDNFKIIDKIGCHYIIPLSENLKDYKEIVKDQKFTGRFVYESVDKNKNRLTQIVYFKQIKKDGKRVILFKNLNENNVCQMQYLANLEKYPEDYSEEKFEELKDWFGTFVLKTNLDTEFADAEYVYCAYKRRWKIETFYNYLKNDYNFKDIQAEDYYKIQGLCFITLISGLIHAQLKKSITPLTGFSVNDFLTEMKSLKLGFNDSHWEYFNSSKKIENIYDKINFNYFEDLIELNKRLTDS